MDAGIPQAEAYDADECAYNPVFYRVCTGAFPRTPADHGKTGSASRRPSAAFVPQSARSSFKTALELARFFPIGVHGSRVCPYCYNTGYSSPGTRCSYCRREER